jgi:hypothetical protein
MDDNDVRVALVKKVRELFQTKCNCWSEVYTALEKEILNLSFSIGKSTGYVFACLVDDVELDEDETDNQLMR